MIIRIAANVLADPQWYPLLDTIVTVLTHSDGLHSFDITQYKQIKTSAWLANKVGDRATTSELIQASTKLAYRGVPSDAVTLEVDDLAPTSGQTAPGQHIQVHPLGVSQFLMLPFFIIVEDEMSDGAFILWTARYFGYDAIRNAYNSGRLAFRHAGGKGQLKNSASALTYGVWPRGEKPIRAFKFRAAALLDSDARFPGDAPNSAIAAAVREYVAFVHILERRTIENYVPMKYLRKRLQDDGLDSLAEAYFRMSQAEQFHFPMKKGFLDSNGRPQTLPSFQAVRWPRLFGQISRFDKWNVCRG